MFNDSCISDLLYSEVFSNGKTYYQTLVPNLYTDVDLTLYDNCNIKSLLNKILYMSQYETATAALEAVRSLVIEGEIREYNTEFLDGKHILLTYNTLYNVKRYHYEKKIYKHITDPDKTIAVLGHSAIAHDTYIIYIELATNKLKLLQIWAFEDFYKLEEEK